ncbi:MAG: hypothetical protein M2R45_03469 [Verrucomicrobia subdivision 3 bacterium]|nr:hypothetical protein [Limisphaerales bacterium]MCS1416680.1 hypothetical protein [Limisphaerales bacterium]
MLVIITADPRTSHRPAEAIRVAAGLAALGELEIEVCFCQTAAPMLTQPAVAFIDSNVIEQYLPLLAKHAKTIWAESSEPYLKGVKQLDHQHISPNELTQLTSRQSQVIRF